MYGDPEALGQPTLARLMIDHRQQNKGYGRQALRLIVAAMREKGWNEVYLSTRPDNVRAEHLYESFGFAKTGEIDDGEVVYRYAPPSPETAASAES